MPNDIDYESSAITIPANGFTQPEHGTISLNEESGEFTYVPNEKYIGTDTFTYWVNDGTINSEPATVAIDVTNRAPIPGGSKVYQYEAWHEFGVNQPLVDSIDAADDDEDSLTYRIDNAPEHGTLDLNAATGAFSYTVDGTFFGFDRFTVIPTDGITDGAPISVSIWSEMHLVFYNDYRLTGSTFSHSHYFPETYLSRAPSQGVLTWAGHSGQAIPQPSGYGDSWEYTPNSTWNPQRDSFEYYGKRGNRTSKPVTVYVIDPAVDTNPLYISNTSPHVLADAPTPSDIGINGDTGFWQGWGGTVSVGVQPQHGNIVLDEQTGAYTFTPNEPAEGERPYLGWDFFRVDAVEPTGEARQQWIQLFVGLEQLGPSTLAAHTPPILQATEGDIAPTEEAIAAGVTHAKNLLTALFADLASLGEGVGEVSTATDEQVLNKLDVATVNVDRIASQYDEYVSQVAKLGIALGRFLADQIYVSEDDGILAASVNALPLTVGSLKASNDQMKKLADSLVSQGEGASIAVETAGKVVTYAENTHKVLTAVQMAGGVGALVQTGATILTQQTLKACAVKAGVAALQWTASATAAAAANYALSYLPLSESQRYWLKVGLDAYQIFAFFKAAKAKVRMGDSCFVAGTNVLVGLNADGSYLTKRIEEIKEGDYVLSRDQYDVGDDLDARRVTQVFRKTSDHLRILTIRDASGNVETIRTTDEHPFWVEGRGWTTAAALERGTALDQPDGTDAVVVSSVRESHPEGIAVFNFEVEDDHTYFVEDGTGAVSAVWVHNVCRTPQEAIAVTVKNRDIGTADLRASLASTQSMEGMDAHHGIPVELLKNPKIASIIHRAAKGGFNFNDAADNGIAIPTPHGSHREYTQDIADDIIANIVQAKTPEGAAGLLRSIVQDRRDNLGTWFDPDPD